MVNIRRSAGLGSDGNSNVNPINRMTPESQKIIDDLRKSMNWVKGGAGSIADDPVKERKRITKAPYPLKGGGIGGPFGTRNR